MSYRLVAAFLSLLFTVIYPFDKMDAQRRGGRGSGAPAPVSGTKNIDPFGGVFARPDLVTDTPPAGSSQTGAGSSVSVAQYSVPAKARSLFEKAAQLMREGKLDQSREKVDAALAIYPKFAEAVTLRGMLQEIAGKQDEAMADYKLAIQYDPKYPVAYVALGALLNSTSRFDESLPLLLQAEQLSPDMWQTYYEIARVNLVKREFTLALHNVDRSSELQGGPQKESPEVHLIRGYALVGLTEIPKAVQELEAFLAGTPSGRAADEARHILDQLREQSDTDSEATDSE